MNDEEQLFDGFALLEPSAEESAMAIEETRAALLAIPKVTSSNPPSPDLGWMRLAVAALVLVVAGIAWLSLPRNDRVWAQVIRQLASADSVRFVSETIEPGSDWEVDRISVFARDFGFTEKHFVDGELIQTELDDGRHHWSILGEHPIATQTESIDFTRPLENLLNPLNSPIAFARLVEQDRVIDGKKYSCYRSEMDSHRCSIWVDANERPRRAVVELNANGRWVVHRRINVTFGVEIERASFQPPRHDEFRVVDPAQLFDELFPVSEAVHREQKLGYELAVHDVRRVNDVEYYVLMSFRPTPETLAKLSLQRGESPGQLLPSIRHERGQRIAMWGWEGAHRLAVAYGNGVRVQALLCNFRGPENERVERARPQFTLFAHAKLWGDVKSISEVTMDFALPKEETPIEEVVRSVYDTIALLEPVCIEELNLVDEQDGREFSDRQFVVGGHSEIQRQGPRPSEISYQEYLAHIQTASFRRDLLKRASEIEKRKRDGSDDPLTFIQELDIPNEERPLNWREKVKQFIDYPDLDVQLAALQFAEREPALLYLGDTLNVIDKSPDQSIQTAARRVLESLKRPLGKFEPSPDGPAIELDLKVVSGLIDLLESQSDVPATVASLRRLSGLDYGDGESKESRRRWIRWFANEKASMAAAHLEKREFIVFGRIVDAEGRPLPGGAASVSLTRSLGLHGTLPSAYTRADIHGNYVLRFGFCKRDPPGLPSGLPIVKARISGHPSSLLSGPDADVETVHWAFVSRYDLENDPILERENQPAIYSHQPFEMNFKQSSSTAKVSD